jgi:hypothetical protein
MNTIGKIVATLFVFILVPLCAFIGLVLGLQAIKTYTDYPLEAGIGMFIGGILGLILAIILTIKIWSQKIS